MSNILVRQSVKRDGSWSYHDLDVLADEITLGAAASNVIVLQGGKIAAQHLTIFMSNQQLRLRCDDKHKVMLNGRAVKKAKIHAGDKIALGGHVVSVMPSPPGFRFALKVDSTALEGKEGQFGREAGDTLPSAKKPAWILGSLTLILLLVVPLLISQYDRSVDRERTYSSFDQIWSSGDLHPAHQLSTGGDCSSCHEELFSRTADTACLNCHTEQIGHVPAGDIVDPGLEEHRCGSCHQEHNGRSSLMSHSNSNCQSCHDVESFTSGHPEFEQYPSPAHSGILFDHDAHNRDYFLDTKKPFECSGCHQLDQAGRHQVTESFEAMCVDCHGEKASSVASKVYHHGNQVISADPVVFFVLPRLDLKRLAVNVDIGAWPKGTKKGARGGLTKLGLTPFMELLLSVDPATAQALGRLKANKVKLSSLKKASDTDIADAVTIVWGVKHLLNDLREDPTNALTSRLDSVTKQPISERALASLTAQMRGEFAGQLTKQWFAAIDDFSLAAELRASPLPITEETPSRLHDQSSAKDDAPGNSWINTTPWQEYKFSMQYQPGGHADNFVKAWLDLSLQIADHTLENTGQTPNTVFGPKEAAQEVLSELADLEKSKPGKAKGAGACSKCHSVISDPVGENQFAWLSNKPNPLESSSTRFSHAQHSTDNTDKCLNCHAWTEHENFLATNKAASGQQSYISNFAPLSQDSCNGCHSDGGRADSQCLNCHSYHVTGESSEFTKKPTHTDPT